MKLLNGRKKSRFPLQERNQFKKKKVKKGEGRKHNLSSIVETSTRRNGKMKSRAVEKDIENETNSSNR